MLAKSMDLEKIILNYEIKTIKTNITCTLSSGVLSSKSSCWIYNMEQPESVKWQWANLKWVEGFKCYKVENRTTRKRIQLGKRDGSQDKGQEKARLFYKGLENHILYLHKTICMCKGNWVTDLRKKLRITKIHVPGTIISISKEIRDVQWLLKWYRL